MATTDKSFAEALHEAHNNLFRDLQELERAVGPGPEASPAELGASLEKVRSHLAEHFRFEEDGGYMAPVLAEEPRFTSLAEELLAEHGQMAQALDAIVREVARSFAVQEGSRQKVRAFVGQVRHHESRENNLVQEAYYSSGATGD
jgi:hypothetical protein